MAWESFSRELQQAQEGLVRRLEGLGDAIVKAFFIITHLISRDMNRSLLCIFGLLRYVLLYTFVARMIPTYASDIILYAFSPSFNIFLPTAVRRLQEQGTNALTFVLQLHFFCCKYISFRS